LTFATFTVRDRSAGRGTAGTTILLQDLTITFTVRTNQVPVFLTFVGVPDAMLRVDDDWMYMKYLVLDMRTFADRMERCLRQVAADGESQYDRPNI
jgi:hypothetical protein